MSFNRLSAVLVLSSITLFPSAPANADSPKNELVVDIANVFGSNVPVSGKSNSNTLSAESEGIAEFPGTKVTSNALPVGSDSEPSTDDKSISPSLTADEDASEIISFPESRVKSDNNSPTRTDSNTEPKTTSQDLNITEESVNPDIVVGEMQFSQEESKINRGLIAALVVLVLILLFAIFRKEEVN